MTRTSKQRTTILMVLKSTNRHPTADWIYEQARKKIHNISLGTVYRNLKLLKEEGIILELDFASSTVSRFDGNTKDHQHFRCEQCGQVCDVDEPLQKRIDKKVAKQIGGQVFNHLLEFRGLCKDCQPRNSLSTGKETPRLVQKE